MIMIEIGNNLRFAAECAVFSWFIATLVKAGMKAIVDTINDGREKK